MKYDIKQYLFVIHELTAREIKRKYARSALGIVWSVLQPLLFMVVMTFIFSGLLGSGSEFAVHYITGYTMWTLFNGATSSGITALVDNQSLFQKSKLPREIFVLSRNYTALVNFGFSCIAMALVLIVFRVKPHWTMVFLFVDVVFELLFSIGISFLLATIYVFYRDIKFIYGNLLFLIVHMVAVYIPIERYPEGVQAFTRRNPLFMFLNVARDSLMHGIVNYQEILKVALWSVVIFVVGFLSFKLKENEMVKTL